MTTASAPLFQPPPIPWHQPLRLEPLADLGPGRDAQARGQALAHLVAEPGVQAVVAFGSRARGQARADSDLVLAVAGAADAERLSGSRWDVFGDGALEGRVLHVAG